MADKKISDLASATTPLAGSEVLPIVQTAATVKVTTDNLTVKNVRSNSTSGILQVTGPAAGSTRVATVPDANFTAARTDAAQTFTGTQTFSGAVSVAGTPTLTALTASTALALDASKNVVSVSNTGSGSNVLATSPALVNPDLGTPSAATLTNATGLPIATGVVGLGTGVATFLATPSSANLAGAVTDETGSGALVFATSPTLVTPNLGTPSAATLTNATDLPISTGVSGLGTGVATFLTTPSSTNLAAAVTDETGSGALVFATSPTLVTPDLGTPSAATLTNATGLPLSTGVTGTLPVANGGTGITSFGTGVATALSQAVTGTGGIALSTSPALTTPNLGTPSAATLTNATGLPISTGVSGLGTNVSTFLATPSSANLAAAVTDETGSGALVFANSPTLVTPALGTPSSGVVTNLTGTASININGTVGATTANTGSFTTLAASSTLSVTGAGTIQGLTVGKGAGSISSNTAIGVNALFSNTTGVQNTASGFQALFSNTTGSYNTASGVNALFANTTGNNNTATGAGALFVNTTGSYNTASGGDALHSNTTGSYNTATGVSALRSNTTGSFNTAIGVNALYNNNTGIQNTASGFQALVSNTTGSVNTASGVQALYSNTTGSGNTASGLNALYSNTTGSYNTAIGVQALSSNTTGDYNTASGVAALQNNTTGTQNTATGVNALFFNTTGSYNTATGFEALRNNTTGISNTAIGFKAGFGIGTNSNTSGSNNTFIGNESVGASATVSNVITLGNGSITTLRCQVTSITALSDRRDKKDIQPLPTTLQFVNALKPVSFIWNTRDGKKVDVPEMGFIAQDLQETQTAYFTVPNLVSDVNPDKLEASPGTLIPILVKAVQELSKQVTCLQSQLSILKGN